MTQLTEHAKTILRAIADGKQIEECDTNNQTWHSVRASYVFQWLGAAELKRHPMFRIKPETRSINGKEFAAPVLDGSYHLSVGMKTFTWNTCKDRDVAYQTIVDALEGKTHA